MERRSMKLQKIGLTFLFAVCSMAWLSGCSSEPEPYDAEAAAADTTELSEEDIANEPPANGPE